MPKSLEDALFMSKKKKINDIYLTREAKELINELFSSHIKAEKFLGELKRKYNYEKFDLRKVFESIDIDGNSFITLNEVEIFLICQKLFSISF